jgi:hypothetical protein
MCKYNVMKTYGEVQIKLQLFSILVVEMRNLTILLPGTDSRNSSSHPVALVTQLLTDIC